MSAELGQIVEASSLSESDKELWRKLLPQLEPEQISDFSNYIGADDSRLNETTEMIKKARQAFDSNDDTYIKSLLGADES